MSLSRRSVLRVLGTGGLIVAAGAAGFASTRDPAAARRPWADAGRLYDDPIRNALSHAITAPNPHNRQPWAVVLHDAASATLYCDTERLLPETDPFGRQIMIGLGCFLELLALAASADGYRAEIRLFPAGSDPERIDSRPVAAVRLHRDATVTADPLLAHAADRRSNKEPFDTAKPVAAAQLAALTAPQTGVAVAGTVDPERVARLRALAFDAHKVEVFTPHTLQESIDLMRIGKREILANPDGIDLGGVFLETLALFGALERAAMADPDSTAFKQGLAMYEAIITSAMGFVWVVTPGNTRADQIAAGRAYLRVNLIATRERLAIHPLSQALQEYPEMDALRAAMDAALAIAAPARLQMLARIGYGPDVPPSPRWPLDTRLRDA